ncbi:hypothetical protein HanPI659440_Chr13g0501291 [Helianthus annuus]|nr:hypothetical protein HanPI659440_Chr13g0501291 [Helianthus annuus]
MAISKCVNNKKHQHHQCYISVPSEIINSISSNSLHSLLLSPKKLQRLQLFQDQSFSRTPKHGFCSFLFVFLFMMKLSYNFDPFNPKPCGIVPQKVSLSLISNGVSSSLNKDEEKDEELKGFWKPPYGLGYRPCLDFSSEYKQQSVEI